MESSVSIIVPVYNVEQWLEKCIDSILAQTYQNLEILLIDDGSPDKCPQICDSYAKKDSRIRVIHKENGGLSDARNAGIENAVGQYLMFIDSDDYIDENMVDILVGRLEQDRTDMALCDLQITDEMGRYVGGNTWKLKNAIVSEKEYWEELYNNANVPYVVAWNKLYKKELFLNVRYEKGRLHEDEIILHQIISRCSQVSVIDRKLYFYVQHSSSITNKEFHIARFDAMDGFRKRMEYFLKNKEIKFAWLTLKDMRGVLCEACRKMDMSVKENKDAYKMAKKLYCNSLKDCCYKKIEWREFFKSFACMLSVRTYSWLGERKNRK